MVQSHELKKRPCLRTLWITLELKPVVRLRCKEMFCKIRVFLPEEPGSMAIATVVPQMGHRKEKDGHSWADACSCCSLAKLRDIVAGSRVCSWRTAVGHLLSPTSSLTLRVGGCSRRSKPARRCRTDHPGSVLPGAPFSHRRVGHLPPAHHPCCWRRTTYRWGWGAPARRLGQC